MKKEKTGLFSGQIRKSDVTPSSDELLLSKINFTGKHIKEEKKESIIDNTSIDESMKNVGDVKFGGDIGEETTTHSPSQPVPNGPDIQQNGDTQNFMFDMGNVTLMNAVTIYFNCIVEKYTVDQAIELLKQVNRYIATIEVEYPAVKGSLVPRFVINSNGGSVVQGLRLFDAIKNNIYPVDTIVSGMAASMGFMLSISGKRKQATANSILMIHQLSAGGQGTFSYLQDYMKFQTKLNDKLIQLTIDNTKAKKEDIKTFFDGETYLLADEALKLGLIDEIVTL